MAITLPSDYKNTTSFIKDTIEDEVCEKYGVNHFSILINRESKPEALKLLRKEYRRYRRQWRRFDIRQQKHQQQIEQRQRILDDDLPW